MVKITIAGKINCPKFAHAKHVGKYLESHLPNFEVLIMALPEEEWKEYIVYVNKRNNWHNFTSPLIYKEFLTFGGAPHLIGDLCDFWEYCNDYYGLESILDDEQLDHLVRSNIDLYEHLEGVKKSEILGYRRILIYGHNLKFLQIFLPELFKIPNLQGKQGINVKFYDDIIPADDVDFYEAIEDIRILFGCKAKRVDSLGESLRYCDLMIVIEDTVNMPSRRPGISNSLSRTNYIAEEIRNFARRDMRLVFATYGSGCISASIIVEETHLDPRNVVVVVSDMGTGLLTQMSQSTEMPLTKFCAPPIWGFTIENMVVDLPSTLRKCHVYKPYKRAIVTSSAGSLPMGTKETELRRVQFIIRDINDLYKRAEHTRSEVVRIFKHQPVYSKVDALVTLLRLWYAGPDSDEIISLGVVSDGSFRLPPYIVFAQPAILVDGYWTPYGRFPISLTQMKMIKDLGDEAERLINDFKRSPKNFVSGKSKHVIATTHSGYFEPQM